MPLIRRLPILKPPEPEPVVPVEEKLAIEEMIPEVPAEKITPLESEPAKVSLDKVPESVKE